jgi:hypothetical protein
MIQSVLRECDTVRRERSALVGKCRRLRLAAFAVSLFILSLLFSSPSALAQGSNPGGSVFIYAPISNAPNNLFLGNATLVSGSFYISFLGMGGNDTFDLIGGNASGVFVATGGLNNTFNMVTGNPGTACTECLGANSTTFSLVSGANSTFNILQTNFNGSAFFSITGGVNCFVNDTSEGPVSSTIFSVILGTNSTANIGSVFTGNQTAINVVY